MSKETLEQDLLEEAAERIFPEDLTQDTFNRLREMLSNAKLQDKDPKITEELISGLRLLSETFTHDELQGILEQLYYVKKQEKLEYYFDQIKLNAKGCDTMSAFQYGYFDTLSALGEN
jgi:Rad3-related DNA helicase